MLNEAIKQISTKLMESSPHKVCAIQWNKIRNQQPEKNGEIHK